MSKFDHWNSWAGGTGAFVIGALGLLLLIYFHYHPLPSTNGADTTPPGIQTTTSDTVGPSTSLKAQVMEWLPAVLIVVGILGGGLLHVAAAKAANRPSPKAELTPIKPAIAPVIAPVVGMTHQAASVGMSRRLLKLSGGSGDVPYYATFSSAMTSPHC